MMQQLQTIEAHRPPQHQRSFGEGRLHVSAAQSATHITKLYQKGCAKLRLPRQTDQTLQAVMINSSGGMTGGDRLHWDFRAATGTKLSVTTQACERVYAAASTDPAKTHITLALDDDAELLWLPQETILFDKGRFQRSINVTLTATSRLLMVEPIVLGRTAMGEHVHQGALQDHWRIHRQGQLIHAEAFHLGGAIADQIQSVALTHTQVAMAGFVLIGADAEQHLTAARACLGDQGGASFWNGKLVGRCLAPSAYALRKMLLPLMERLSNGTPLPKIWTL